MTNKMNHPKDVVVRFWSKVASNNWDYNICWIWTAGQDKDGYGRFTPYPGCTVGSHRFSYEYFYGPIPPRMLICHTCDTPSCVNPLHLFCGTNVDNLQDMSYKDRSTYGEKSANAKLTESDIHDILTGIENGIYNIIAEISTKYSLSSVALRRILCRETWVRTTNQYAPQRLENIRYRVFNLGGSSLNKDDVNQIRILVQSGMKIKDIAAQFNVDRKTIYNIKTGRTRSDVI